MFCRRIIDNVDRFEAKKINFRKGLSKIYSPSRQFFIARTDAYTYNISGSREFSQEDEIEYRIHLLHLRADESQKVQFDPSHVPTPVLEKRLSHTFRVALSTVVKYGFGRSLLPTLTFAAQICTSARRGSNSVGPRGSSRKHLDLYRESKSHRCCHTKAVVCNAIPPGQDWRNLPFCN
jgi:hypothetical protein